MTQGVTETQSQAQQVTPDVFSAQIARLVETIGSVIDGKQEVIRHALICLFAEGHLLIEDVPGVGKTMLARSIGQSLHASVRRIQFTPDLLPGDVTGTSVYNPLEHRFEFHPGAVFANIVIADEINRASPKTQSALLESMAERQVTVDGDTRALPSPFFVVATLNPMEMEGTFTLPEAQLDRFMMRISMGYPHPSSEAHMLRNRSHADPLDALRPILSLNDVQTLIAWARTVHVASPLADYIVALCTRTRNHPDIALGASPRAGLQLLRAAMVVAAIEGRAYVVPDDVTELIVPVLAHRIVLRRGSASRTDVGEVLQRIVAETPVPLGGQK